DLVDLDRVPDVHEPAPSWPSSSTTPLVPSTVRRWPVLIAVVAAGTPTTAGIPYSRATIEPCDIMPPISMTTAPAVMKSGVQPGSVEGATRTSPGSRRAPAGSRTTRAGPEYRPGEAALPVIVRPSPKVGAGEPP